MLNIPPGNLILHQVPGKLDPLHGVAERFIRTLKEQVIYGRIYRNLEELRSAIAAFIERYNSRWLVERLAYRSPRQARQEALALAA